MNAKFNFINMIGPIYSSLHRANPVIERKIVFCSHVTIEIVDVTYLKENFTLKIKVTHVKVCERTNRRKNGSHKLQATVY